MTHTSPNKTTSQNAALDALAPLLLGGTRVSVAYREMAGRMHYIAETHGLLARADTLPEAVQQLADLLGQRQLDALQESLLPSEGGA